MCPGPRNEYANDNDRPYISLRRRSDEPFAWNPGRFSWIDIGPAFGPGLLTPEKNFPEAFHNGIAPVGPSVDDVSAVKQDTRVPFCRAEDIAIRPRQGSAYTLRPWRLRFRRLGVPCANADNAPAGFRLVTRSKRRCRVLIRNGRCYRFGRLRMLEALICDCGRLTPRSDRRYGAPCVQAGEGLRRMIEQFTVRTFKTLDDVTVDLGLVNVFIGANGAGKSNLLEALGILSAAADGKVDDQSLLARGVRPGLPALYKSAFPASPGKKIPPHLFFGARSGSVRYEVTLHNPLEEPAPAWRFKTELWKDEKDSTLVARMPTDKSKRNPERGLAALEAVQQTKGDALEFLTLLQNYVIFSPTTSVLRGIVPETQPKHPVGLSGGNLPQAVHQLFWQSRADAFSREIFQNVLQLTDWAKSVGWSRADQLPLSPTAATSKEVIRFSDKFMRKGRNVLSGYDASEGALYALFLAVVAGHRRSPALCAVDNADHGLNPRLARSLFARLCQWHMNANNPHQILLTTHNPLVLDGLPLQDDRVRLFTVSRTVSGRTSVRRVKINDSMLKKAEQGWSLSRLWVMGHLGGVPDV